MCAMLLLCHKIRCEFGFLKLIKKKEKFSIVHRLCRFLQEGYIYIQGPILIAQVQQQTQCCTSWVHANVGVSKCSCLFLVHVGAAAQSANGLGDGECRSEGDRIN